MLEKFRRNLGLLAQPLEVRGANPYAEWGNSDPPPPGSAVGSIGGLGVSTETAVQIAAVYGCCALLADSVSSLPLRVLDKPATVNTAKELELPKWLERPYELVSLTDWLVSFVWSLALRGNFFGQIIERDSLGFPVQIMPLHPDIVRPEVVNEGTKDWRIQWYVAGEPIRYEDLFHVRYQSMPGVLLGLNPIEVMKYPLGLAHVMDVHAEQTYGNSADPRGVIQTKREMNPTSAAEMKAAWDASHQGVHKSGKIAILDNEAEFKAVSLSPADQQLLEARKWSAEEIAGIIFRVPPHMVGLNERSTSFGRGIEQQERTFVQNTLSGYLTRASRSLTECLPDGQYVDLDIRHRIRGDSLQRAEVAYKMRLSGCWTADMANELFDLPPLPDGEGKLLQSPTNAELLQMQLEELKKLEAAPDVPPEPVVASATNGHGSPKRVPTPK